MAHQVASQNRYAGQLKLKARVRLVSGSCVLEADLCHFLRKQRQYTLDDPRIFRHQMRRLAFVKSVDLVESVWFPSYRS